MTRITLDTLKHNRHNGYVMEAVVKNERHQAFCDIFLRLFREQRAQGVENPRVGRLAAMTAGYGQESWCPSNSIQTADVMFNKLTKRPDVLEYLRGKGLERVGRQWREVQTDED